MARKDYYDWRGIAMLTQQLGQLFEPSKARLMSDQQEHEMNMLMAKKAWDTQSKRVDQLGKEYDGLLADIADYEKTLMGKGLEELTNASMEDGANPDQSAEIRDNTDIKKFGDLNDLATKYQDMIRNEKATLDNLVSYNANALMGEQWRKGTMTKKDRKGVMQDYYKDANVDGIPELSYEEGQNMIKRYIKDTYTVGEGEDGVDITFPSFKAGEEPETFTVRPEAVAFRAGYESNIGTGTGRGKAEKDLITAENTLSKQLIGDKSPNERSDQEVIDMVNFNRKIAEDINNKEGVRVKLSMLVESRNGKIQLKEKVQAVGYTYDEVVKYLASTSVYNSGVKELGERQIDYTPMATGEYKTEILQDFNVYGTHPDSLMSQISVSTKAGKDEAINAYNEFLERSSTMTGIDRRKAIETFQKWLTE